MVFCIVFVKLVIIYETINFPRKKIALVRRKLHKIVLNEHFVEHFVERSFVHSLSHSFVLHVARQWAVIAAKASAVDSVARAASV